MRTLKAKTSLLAPLIVFFFAVSPLLPAQSLLDNDFYKQATDLMARSQAAMDRGDYDGAAQLAAQARGALAQSDGYVAAMMQFYRANGWLNQAKDRVAYAKSIKADVNYKAAYDTAVADVASAKSSMDITNYDASITASQDALAVLKDVAPKVAAAPAPTPEPTPAPTPTPASAVATLPQYYVVRLVLPLRDCFWRIAAYPWVYNDPWKWKLLYDANKDLIPDPNNPDLVEVGTRIEIPSLAGETRSGDYDPTQEYPSVSMAP